MSEFPAIAKSINEQCLCKTLDKEVLQKGLGFDSGFFSETMLFISRNDLKQMKDIISSVELVISSEPFRKEIIQQAPEVSRPDFKTKGMFMGYDFHLTEEGPRIIEINTNAGGAYLNLHLAKAQVACCEEQKPAIDLSEIENKFLAGFLNEWALQKGSSPLKTVAIMDESPEQQFLYPEFRLFKEMFEKNNIEAFILDPKELELKNNELWFKDQKIDLIYNRSTDFYFHSPVYAGIKEAYLKGTVVVTPSPRHHALFADKENLEIFCDGEKLQKMEVSESDIDVLLKGIPKTVKLTDQNRDDFWSKRKSYFFKPTSGYGSKATYRGDKITTKVWEELKKTEYVAQEFTPPGIRMIESDGKQVELKHDIRVYTYNGDVLLLASRLYSGQTTNFRTVGGGFAPVYVV